MISETNPNVGRVYWFTGLSGAGKTTLGRLFYEHLLVEKKNIVFLDGDTLREVFGQDLGHSLSDRFKSAERNSRLCKMMAEQGLDVVCATISMFHASRDWNRRNIRDYVEIYMKASLDTLIARDQKGLYSRALRGEVKDIIGIDLPIEEPNHPDVIIVNDGSATKMELLHQLLNQLENLEPKKK